jgi:hypothetical protein
MIDRLLSELTRGRGRPTFGAVRVLALLAGVTASAAAQRPPATNEEAPAPSAPAVVPAPAAPVPAPPTPATDEDDDDKPPPNSRVNGPDANPAAALPEVSPNAVVTTPRLAPRPAPEPDLNQIDDGQRGTHQEHWLFGVGLRETFVTGKGYDPFSTDNVLPQVSLDLGRAFYANGPLSIAGLVAWDYGSTKATARQADTSLVVHRITAGAEGRYHLIRRLYVFGRIAPGALHSSATLRDQVAGIERESQAWVFTGDLLVGAAFEFAGDARGASTRPRAWVGADGGYSWSASSKVDFKDTTGSGSQAPARLEPLRFDDLALRGGFFRLTATLTY